MSDANARLHTGLTQRDMDFEKLTTATRDRILAAIASSAPYQCV